MASKTMVVNCAALSGRVLLEMLGKGSLSEIELPGAKKTQVAVPVRPVFPAVTMPVQASMITGVTPDKHGCISNTRLDKRTLKYDSWEQSSLLLDVEPFWKSKEFSQHTVATICWQLAFYNGADICVSPAPVHSKEGTFSAIYTKPAALEEVLEDRLGKFPLQNYWGPMSSMRATEWIADSAKIIIDKHAPDLILAYLPYLDCLLQKYSLTDLKAIEDIDKYRVQLESLIEFASSRGYNVILLSEYGITPVSMGILVNKYLREQGFLEVSSRLGIERIDPFESSAFALPDHQVAGVYVRRKEDLNPIKEALSNLHGVDKVLTRQDNPEIPVWHDNAPEIIVTAQPQYWFHYSYWLSDEGMPPFARTVDIHSKPGYDPLELFFDPATRSIETEKTELVKGSHGLIPSDELDFGILVSDFPFELGADPIDAIDLPVLLRKVILQEE